MVYFGLLPLLPQVSHLINDSFNIKSQIVSDVALFLLLIFVFAIWELNPAPCILQYLALCKWVSRITVKQIGLQNELSIEYFHRAHFSTRKRLVIAYSVCISLAAWTSVSFSNIIFQTKYWNVYFQQHYTLFYTGSEYRLECSQIAHRIFDLTSDELVDAHCASLRFTQARIKKSYTSLQQFQEHSLIPMAMFGVLPSYCIAYLLFVLCCYKVLPYMLIYGLNLIFLNFWSITLWTRTIRTANLSKLCNCNGAFS